MIPGSANPLLLKSAAAAGGYQVQRSLRFNSSDSGFLSRTPGTASNRKTFTYSTWAKLSALGTLQAFFSARSDDNNRTTFFYQDSQFKFQNIISGSAVTVNTSAVFRDPSAWYCILLAVDTDQGTSSNRVRLYVNGVEQTLSGSYPGPGDSTQVNNTVAHAIGRIEYQSPSPTGYFDGYMADAQMVDGQQLTPSSFTEVSATTGQLIPLAYSGSFGTNGFWLKFSDNSAATAATLGKDYSGNSNNWTPNNLSVTAGAGNDSLVDTPTSISATDTGVGGEIRGNYATLNPLLIISTTTLSNGNLESIDTGSDAISLSTIGVSSGKWYWEITGLDITGTTSNQRSVIGIVKNPQLFALSTYVGSNANGFGYYSGNGQKITSGTSSSYGATWATSNVMGVALDLDNGTLVFYKNNTSQGTAFTGLNTGDTYFPAASQAGSGKVAFNFGQRAFAYTAPSGFKALCDTNLGAPVVAKPNTLMDVALYTGNGGNQSITLPGGFNPDLVWVKSRSNSQDHYLFDAVRGGASILRSNTTGAESTGTTYLSFDTSGFSSLNGLSSNGYTYVGWAWDAGTSTVSNTAGSITSQVRANVSAGFSVVTYTGNGTQGATIGHGLNVIPQLVIIKSRTSTDQWDVYHISTGYGGVLRLNSTAAFVSAGDAYPSSHTSSVIKVGSSSSQDGNGSTYVAYCFAPVVGYGNGLSYVGNGSADGPFVYLGFRPKLILIKCSSTTGNWVLLDAEREGYNVDNDPLFPNLSDAEGTTDLLDITSNGFKIRSTNADVNASAATYIVYAWASNPFQYSRAR